MPKQAPQEDTSIYIPGTYLSEITLNHAKAAVSVNVDNEKIVSIDLVTEDLAEPIFYPLLAPTLETISSQIVESQSTNPKEIAAKDQVIDSNAYTKEVLLSAVDRALEDAQIPVSVSK